MTDTTSRNLTIDLIRILATALIVFSHVTTLIYQRPDFFGTPFWWLNYILLNFGHLGTPLFFMISGYLLHGKTRSGKTNLEHTFSRLGIPFISFYLLSNIVISWIHSSPPFNLFFENIFTGGGNYLYFLVGLGILYLINPTLQKILEHFSKNQFQHLLLFLMSNTSLYVFGAYLLSKDGQVPNETFLYWFLALGLFLCGSYFKKYGVAANTKKRDLFLSIIPIIFNILFSFFFQRMYLQTHNLLFLKLSYSMQSYLSFSVMISSIAAFRLLFSFNLNSILNKNILRRFTIHLSTICFGIYLVHMIILEYFLFRTPLTIDNGPFNPAIMIALITIALFFTSYIFSLFVSNMPVIKRIVGIR